MYQATIVYFFFQMEKKLCFFEVATKKLKKFVIQYISLCNVKTCFWSLLNFERISSYEALFSEHKNSLQIN